MAILNIFSRGENNLTAKDFLEKRAVTLGASGTGKTNTVAVLAEALGEVMAFVIVDPHGEYYGLLEMFDALIIGRSENVHLTVEPDQAARMAEFIYDTGRHAILDLLWMNEGEREDFVTNFFRAFWDRAKRNKKPFAVFIDEAHNFIPEGRSSPTKTLMKSVALEGRKFGLALILATQTTTELSKTVLKQLGLRFFHAVFDVSDLATYLDRLPEEGFTKREQAARIVALEVGEALFVNRASSRKVQVRRRTTFHASDTPDAEGNHALQPRVIDSALIGELAALLTRAEGEAVIVGGARAAGKNSAAQTELIARLRDQIKLLEARPRVEQVTVEVPRLGEVERENISDIAAHMRDMVIYLEQLAKDGNAPPLPLAKQVENGAGWGVVFTPAQAANPFRAEDEPLIEGEDEEQEIPPPPFDPRPFNAVHNPVYLTFVASGRESLTRRELAILTGMSPRGGGFLEVVRRLIAADYCYELDREIWLRAAAPRPELPALTRDDVFQRWANKADAPSEAELKILFILIDNYPAGFTRAALADRIGQTATGGGFLKHIRRLIGNQLIQENDRELSADPAWMIAPGHLKDWRF